jgi:hypothetical protein
MLCPGLLGSYDDYGKRYCVDPNKGPPARGFGWGGQQWQEDPYRWVDQWVHSQQTSDMAFRLWHGDSTCRSVCEPDV